MLKQMWLAAAILSGVATSAAADPMRAPQAHLKAEMDQAMRQAQAQQLQLHREHLDVEIRNNVRLTSSQILKAERKRKAMAAAQAMPKVDAGTAWNRRPMLDLAERDNGFK